MVLIKMQLLLVVLNFGGNLTIHNSTNAPYIDFVESGATSDSKARITMDQIDTNNGEINI